MSIHSAIPEIINSVEEGESEKCEDLVKRALLNGVGPIKIIDEGLSKGIKIVGEKFGNGELFLPDLMLAAEAMRSAIKILNPELEKMKIKKKKAGTVMLGTVYGDIHDIGKSIVATILEINGYEIIDLGNNVKAMTFIEKIKLLKPQILGLSAMLSTTMREQKNVADEIVKAGLRSRVKIIVGGAPVSEQWAQDIGADGYGSDAEMAVRIVKKLINE